MDALLEYESRQTAALALQALLERTSIRIGNARLITALLFAALLWVVFARDWPAWVLLGPTAIFGALMIWHAQVQRRRERAKRTAAWYGAGIARVKDGWPGTGATGESYLSEDDSYASDIDIFGQGSLFQMLSRARTTLGEAALAEWLLRPATRDEIEKRQFAASEIEYAIDLREDVALIGEDMHAISDPSRLIKWSAGEGAPIAPFTPIAAALLAIAGLAFGTAYLAGYAPLFPFLTVFLLSASFTVWLRTSIARALEGFETTAADLESLSTLIRRLERERFSSPRLKSIRAALDAAGVPASKRIARLRRWIELFDSTDHILLRILNPVLLLRQQFAFGILKWRGENGPYIAGWLQAVADFEALSSLAALAYERPTWAFPTVVESGQPWFRAVQLSHPLIPAKRAVPNNVELGDPTRLLIISGSNMSGKSTLLRSIGLAAALAFAGAPVPADELTLSRLQIGASLRTTDSLQDNRSRFMAELLRLRQIVELTKRDVPVLFLLDELLSGTNSHDRRIGASAILRGLVDAGAIGVTTTHDLALTAITEELPGRAANAHFTDEIEAGELRFDYLLRPGVVAHSNALELMRAVGLIS